MYLSVNTYACRRQRKEGKSLVQCVYISMCVHACLQNEIERKTHRRDHSSIYDWILRTRTIFVGWSLLDIRHTWIRVRMKASCFYIHLYDTWTQKYVIESTFSTGVHTEKHTENTFMHAFAPGHVDSNIHTEIETCTRGCQMNCIHT